MIWDLDIKLSYVEPQTHTHTHTYIHTRRQIFNTFLNSDFESGHGLLHQSKIIRRNREVPGVLMIGDSHWGDDCVNLYGRMKV